MIEKTAPDWELIERQYRAGLLSVREIAASQGITHGAINKRAKRDDWPRDLKAKVKAKADALVSKSAVSKQVSADTKIAERIEVEANANLVYEVRLAHRTDITRSRKLANKLLDELESLTDEQGTIKSLITHFKEGDHEDGEAMADMLALANKIGALPSRTKTMKELAETLKTLIGLERQAYGIDDQSSEESYEDRLARLMGEAGR